MNSSAIPLLLLLLITALREEIDYEHVPQARPGFPTGRRGDRSPDGATCSEARPPAT